jgi:hypothetical protein
MYDSMTSERRTRKQEKPEWQEIIRKARGKKARGRKARERKQEGQASRNKVIVLMRAVFSKGSF